MPIGDNKVAIPQSMTKSWMAPQNEMLPTPLAR